MFRSNLKNSSDIEKSKRKFSTDQSPKNLYISKFDKSKSYLKSNSIPKKCNFSKGTIETKSDLNFLNMSSIKTEGFLKTKLVIPQN